jgi:hypothetical protein
MLYVNQLSDYVKTTQLATLISYKEKKETINTIFQA